MNLTRWRNSHGFGVHSPFGFKIAKGVVSPGNNYSYYAEPEIIRLARRDKFPTLQARHFVKLHRLVCMLNIRYAYTSVKLNRCMQLALSRAGVTISKNKVCPITSNAGDLSNSSMHSLHIFEGDISGNIVREILSIPGNVLIIYNRDPLSLSRTLKTQLDSGIIISGHFCTLAFSRIQTQPVCYQMDL